MTDLGPKINQNLKVVLINDRAGLLYDSIPVKVLYNNRHFGPPVIRTASQQDKRRHAPHECRPPKGA